MIKPGEIDKIAIKEGVRATQIQKDYIISWVLWGISQSEFLNENLVFKGGTCLKKIYFSDYRFSEDMDFTLIDDTINDDEIIKNIEILFEAVFDASRIPLTIENGSFGVHKDSGSIKFKIEYKGSHGSDTLKVDITRGENLLYPTDSMSVFNTYSDLKEEAKIIIKAYSLEEVLIEKLTALMGRTIPRDLYDFHYLTEEFKMQLEDVYIEFMIKAKHKGHTPKGFLDKVSRKENIFLRDWEDSLAKQMKKGELSDFKQVWRKSNAQFKKLMTLIEV